MLSCSGTLWGHPATVQGIAHFHPSGWPRLIGAHRIGAQVSGDTIFESLPNANTSRYEDPIARCPVESLGQVDPMVIWGALPGDEPIDRLVAQLD